MKGWSIAGLLAFLVAGGIWLLADQPVGQQQPDYLPWQITLDAQGQTEVFHLRPGETTLREFTEQLQHFPELAVFVKAGAEPRLEAYFGKRRLGLFDARVIVELAADPPLLERFVAQSPQRQAQPSGSWRYLLSEAAIADSNALPVNYLIYIPVADYDVALVTQHFGESSDRFTLADGSTYWFYPQRGLVILLNSAGSDIFYYSSPADFPALRQRLLSETQQESGND